MARFSVYPNPSSNGYLIDVQADAMSHFNTRMVIPLLPLAEAPKPATVLNPLFEIDGETYSMVTQYMAAYPVKALKSAVFGVEDRRDEIVAAIDLLLQGF
ncbi:plasmid maintenance protein CcdB [Denitratisoma sp. DHT3]|uniref:CcdB family protein n=1 Tax=Denitratisoma sp. DHT3 TaxID=1981880 RepID=UPI00119868CA|nr:CcdB family protein [Denitratisoma sp. DHT3]QDX82035.1 plasmid maintenance protein CcdB [Denitratisoma sp. DHT3]